MLSLDGTELCTDEYAQRSAIALPGGGAHGSACGMQFALLFPHGAVALSLVKMNFCEKALPWTFVCDDDCECLDSR